MLTLPKPALKINFLGFTFHSFHFFGVTGFLTGAVLGMSLAGLTGLSPWIVLLMALAAAATFFVLAFAYKILTGNETLVYYQHEIAILLVCAAALKLAGWPVLPYLDLTLLGVGVFLFFGRMGCYSVGCCHGRPAKWGVQYSHEHAANGFTWYYVGVPLIPIQLIESATVCITLLAGCALILAGYPAGTFLSAYTLLYGAARFFFELYRGDPERPYWGHFSEAQWTTILLMAAVCVFQIIGWLPMHLVHLTAAFIFFAFAAGFWIFQSLNNRGEKKLKSPRHLNELAAILKKLAEEKPSARGSIQLSCSSLGLCFSKGSLRKGKLLYQVYSVSWKGGPLSPQSVQMVGGLIRQIRLENSSFEISEGGEGVVHLLFPQTST